MRTTFVLTMLCFATGLAGCTDTHRVADAKEEQPFVRPGQQALGVVVFKYGPLLAHDFDLVWSDGWRRWSATDLAEAAKEYFEAQGGERQVEVDKAGDGVRTRYGTTHTIVCVDPLVILVTPVPYTPEGLPGPYNLKTRNRTGLGNTSPTSFQLAGYAYGASAPFHEDLAWYSPTLNCPPAPAEVLPTGQARLPTMWGWIVCQRDGDRWVVDAVMK